MLANIPQEKESADELFCQNTLVNSASVFLFLRPCYQIIQNIVRTCKHYHVNITMYTLPCIHYQYTNVKITNPYPAGNHTWDPSKMNV